MEPLHYPSCGLSGKASSVAQPRVGTRPPLKQLHSITLHARPHCVAQRTRTMPGIAPDARPCLICGISCLVYVTVPGISAPLAPQPSLAASASTSATVSAAVARVRLPGAESTCPLSC